MVLAAALAIAPTGAARAAAATTAAQSGSPQPNLLIVVADDLGVDVLGFYGVGETVATTPVLDALAARSVLFENAWASPVCSPSRMTLQTGRLPFRTGVGALVPSYAQGLLESEWTLPEMVDAGTDFAYAHAAFGKWALKVVAQGGVLAPNVAGWDHFAGTLELPSYYAWNKVVDGVESVATGYVTSDTVDDALGWAAGVEEPWMMYLAFNAPHAPFHPPPPALHTVDLSGAGPPEEDPAPYYRAMVEALDTELGRLLEEVDPNLEDTVLIFLGDNGTPGDAVAPPFEPGKAKTTIYQGGVHVPLLVAGPIVTNPGRSDALVSIADVFATVADLTGTDLSTVLPPDLELDSISLLPYLLDPATPSQRDIVQTESFLPNGFGTPVLANRAARDERYKLLQFWNQEELYDLWLDPLEENDLLLAELDPEPALAHVELANAIEDLHGFLGASVHHYGCPSTTTFGSLATAEDEPALGGALTFLIDNVLGTQAPGAATYLFWNTAPDDAFPCGAWVEDWGMGGGGAEFLLSEVGLPTPISGPPWNGVEPAVVTMPLPSSPGLVDMKLYAQGALLDPSGLGTVENALTNALAIQVGP